jgi:type I restriction enzyme S subunit
MSSQSNDIPAGFRLTELGLLPEDWRVVSLGDVFSEVDRRVAKYTDADAERFPVLSLTKNYGLMLQSERFGKRIALEDVNDYKIVERGEIVYNPYVIWEGAIHILDHFDCGLVSPVYPVLETNVELADAYYLDPLLRTSLAIAAYNRFASGAVNRRRSIRKTDFMAIKIPLPPLPEQKAIAWVLSTIQKAIETQDKIIASARELKKSLMRHLFTYGPVPVAEAEQVPLKETEIGLIPEHWETSYIGQHCKILTGGTPRTEISEYYNPPEIPWIKSGEVNKGIISNVDTYISRKGLQNSNANILPKDSVVIALAGRGKTRGTTAILNIECACNQSIACMVPNDRVNHYFLRYYLTHLYDYIRSITGDKDRSGLNLQLIAKIPLFYPSLIEQQEIAHILLAVDKKTERDENRKASLRTLFRTMLHLLMTGKVRVRDLEAKLA